MNSKYLSFVIPVYNEEATIKPLFERILDVTNLAEIDSYEIIFIDDGSNDSSWIEINKLIKEYPQKIRGIRFRRNFGKSSALSAGFKKATGNIIFTLDADLQDDPAEVPKFLEKLESGYDLVSGWRKHRNDPFSKTLPSKLFNGVTSILTGVKLHDFNCGLKAYKKEVLDCIKVYGELHRYIPVLAHSLGFKISEVTVRHHQRKQGKSKYGLERYTRGFLDLLTVLATTHYLHKPGHLFGSLGLFFGAMGMTSLGYLTVLWFMEIRPIGTRPLFLFGILCIILSVQLISLGILAELITKNIDDDYVDKQICEVIEESEENV
ncbi:MAG: glycosyltransferase family 2 protein [Okeania sp. SIO3B5]|uniref:glycosyltransferase family 2 protein n=1 Tax=Okeania sp. SIO3B5 TaxID=2607811 RepID=UPI001400022B|nr:glycosyltransferase family 2 protein [Okeania sp. SIO3B5]NEO54750.1 glycosyltransferase family 2 protein [Okeania sp. SIO3B5]